jgi:hypothetical protein
MNELGLRKFRAGFTRTPALDRAFALGWPVLCVIGEANGVPEAAEGRRWVWTKADAEARVRAKLVAANVRLGEGPLDREVALGFARQVIPFGWKATLEDTATDLFLLEGLVGPGVLADAMIAALEEISPNEWKRADRGAVVPYYLLGFVLLRTEATVALALRDRLADLYARRHDEQGPLTAGLDLVLHGAAGARRSALHHGPRDEDIDPFYALLADDEPAFVETIARGQYTRFERRHGARLAFLGGDQTARIVADQWYASGDARAHSYFVATVRTLASDALLEPMRAGVRLSHAPAECAAWLDARGVAALPPPPAPVVPDETSATIAEADEFGFVFLPEESAAQLTGEDDHPRLTAELDPTNLEPRACEAYGAAGVIFCRTDAFAFAAIPGGALITWGVSDEEVAEVLANAPARRWLPLTTLDGRFVALPASRTLAEARAEGLAFTVPLPPGRYVVRSAARNPANSDDDELPPVLWLCREV